MDLFNTIFRTRAGVTQTPPARPVRPQPVPSSLPKIQAPEAARIVETSQPSQGAQQILAADPKQTPPQYLSSLQEKQMGDDMIKTIAHGMPDREGVHWAAQSAEKVADNLPAEDVQAMKCAQDWVKNPTPENKAAAGEAAAMTNYRGPGAWAAQGAVWSQPEGATSGGPRMTPHAVTTSVQLSSAIKANPNIAAPAASVPATAAPAAQMPTAPVSSPTAPSQPALPQTPITVPPEIESQKFQQQLPFIEQGLDIASGKNPCA